MKLGKFDKHHFIILLFLAFLSLGYLYPMKFWSYSALLIYPIWFQVVVFLILSLLACRFFLDFCKKDLEKYADFLYDNNTYLVSTAVFLLSFIIYWIIFDNSYYIGDSVQVVARTAEIADGAGILSERFFILYFYNLIDRILPFNLWSSIVHFHIFCGGLYGVLCFLLSKQIGNDNLRKLAFFCITFFAMQALVFNHIEFYSVGFLLLVVCFIFLAKNPHPLHCTVSFDRGSLLFLIPALIMVPFHPLLAWVLFYLAVIFLFAKIRRYALEISIGMVGFFLILGLIINRFYSIAGYENVFVINTYFDHFFSLDHWRNVLNYLLFSTPMIFAFLLVFFPSKFKGKVEQAKVRDAFWYYLYIGSIIALFMLIFLNIELGGSDQDIASIITFPITLFIAYTVSRDESRRYLSFAILLSLVFFMINGFYGVSQKLQHERGRQFSIDQNVPYFADDSYPCRIRFAYLTSKQDFDRPDSLTKHYGIMHARSAIEAYPDDRRPYLYLASFYERRDKFPQTEAVLVQAFLKAKGGYELMGNFVGLYRRWGNHQKNKTSPFILPELVKPTGKVYDRSYDEMVDMFEDFIVAIDADDIRRHNVGKQNPMWIFRYQKTPFRIEMYPDHVAVFSSVRLLPDVMRKSPDILWYIWPRNHSGELDPAKFFFFRDLLLLGARYAVSDIDEEKLLNLMEHIMVIRAESIPVIEKQISGQTLHIVAQQPFVLLARRTDAAKMEQEKP